VTDAAGRDDIDDIIEAVEKIQRYTAEYTYQEFIADEKTVDAVLRNLEIIGEATKQVPDTVTDRYDAVPWTEMAGMRDKLIHGYGSVDLDIIWETVTDDIPALHEQLQAVRNDMDGK
jgi:uncharacterized protein with HEPN domain